MNVQKGRKRKLTLYSLTMCCLLLMLHKSDAQRQSQTSVVVSQSSQQPVLSPYDIKRLVDEDDESSLQPYWQQLKIKPGAFVKPGEIDSADLFAEHFDNELGKELLLRLHNDWITRYVLYKQHRIKEGRVEWRYVNYLDLEYQKYGPPEHRIEYERNKGQERWLVISSQTASGTGVSANSDEWYKVSDKGFEQVLSYPAKGYESQYWSGVCGRNLSSKVDRVEKTDGDTTVRVELSIKFDCDNGEDGDAEFSKQQKLLFVKPDKATEFALDTEASKITESDLNAVFDTGVESLTPEIFLKYNAPELTKIAANGSKENKQWLRTFLDKCSDIVEKQQLQQLLKNHN